MISAQPNRCCKAIPGVASHAVDEALIGQMLITEYYDGATSGFIQCSGCLSVYHFVTLDWSQNQVVRVIALSLVPSDSMARLVSFFAEAPPRSPWIPEALRRGSDQDLDRMEAFLSGIVPQAQPPNIVMAWNVLTNEILSARRVGSLPADHFVSLFDLQTTPVRTRYDWFEDLGVDRVEE